MSTDFGLSVAMPAAAAARQMDLIEGVRSAGREEDFSAVTRTLHQLADVPS